MYFLYCYLPEPEVTEFEVDRSKPELKININNSMTISGRTFDIDLPQITMKYGPFRLVLMCNYWSKQN